MGSGRPNVSCSWPSLAIRIPPPALRGTWRLQVASSPATERGRLSMMLLAALKRMGRGVGGQALPRASGATHWIGRPIKCTPGLPATIPDQQTCSNEKANSSMGSFAMLEGRQLSCARSVWALACAKAIPHLQHGSVQCVMWHAMPCHAAQRRGNRTTSLDQTPIQSGQLRE